MNKTKMLKKNYEFRRVLTKGKYYSGQYIEAFILKNSESYNKIGLAISVKIGKATIRNFIKRLIKENYKILEEDILVGNSMVFLWKKKANTEEASFSNIEKDLKIIFKKAEIIEEGKEVV